MPKFPKYTCPLLGLIKDYVVLSRLICQAAFVEIGIKWFTKTCRIFTFHETVPLESGVLVLNISPVQNMWYCRTVWNEIVLITWKLQNWRGNTRRKLYVKCEINFTCFQFVHKFLDLSEKLLKVGRSTLLPLLTRTKDAQTRHTAHETREITSPN